MVSARFVLRFKMQYHPQKSFLRSTWKILYDVFNAKLFSHGVRITLIGLSIPSLRIEFSLIAFYCRRIRYSASTRIPIMKRMRFVKKR